VLTALQGPVVHQDSKDLKVLKDSAVLQDQRVRKDFPEHLDNKASPETQDLLGQMVLRVPVVTQVLRGRPVVLVRQDL